MSWLKKEEEKLRSTYTEKNIFTPHSFIYNILFDTLYIILIIGLRNVIFYIYFFKKKINFFF